MNEAEFTEQFTETLDAVLVNMAESPEIEPSQFFSVACLLENLQFFAPVIFSVLKQKEK